MAAQFSYMTVLGSRYTCACSEADFSSQNCLRGGIPKSSILLRIFSEQKYSMQRIFIKKCLLHKMVYNWVQKFSRGWRGWNGGSELAETAVRNTSVNFGTLVKQCEKCINVGGGYIEKCFFQVRISHVLCSVSICGWFMDSPSYDTSIAYYPYFEKAKEA
jgi:hypothetical protein